MALTIESVRERLTSDWQPWVLVFLGVLLFRLYYCSELPVNTGDILRHPYYGLYVGEYGLSVAGKGLVELNPALYWVSWAGTPYNYPAIPLLFFSLISKISPTIFFAKFALTLIEAISAFLVYRYTSSRLLALIYWASPISIWWVSHEGQFEPLQNLFVILSLLLLIKRPLWAFGVLGVAVLGGG